MKRGIKHDAEKPRWSLLPWSALAHVVAVLEYGAKKYAPGNWKRVEPSRYDEALLRHVVAWQDGEWLDPESGLPHIAHAICNGLFILWFNDRRSKTSPQSRGGET